MAKECTLSTGKLPPRGLPRNSVVRITDRPDMTSDVHCGHKAANQTMSNSNSAAAHIKKQCSLDKMFLKMGSPV